MNKKSHLDYAEPTFGDKLDKRQLILSSASKVFARQGYHKTTMSHIAAEAKIGKSTVYEYFESKDQLFGSIIMGGCQFYLACFARQQQEFKDAPRRLVHFIEGWLFFVERHYQLFQMIIGCLHENAFADIDEQIKNLVNQVMIEPLTKILEEGIVGGEIRALDIDVAAKLIVGMLLGLSQWLIVDGAEPENFGTPFRPKQALQLDRDFCCHDEQDPWEISPQVKQIAKAAGDIILKGVCA